MALKVCVVLNYALLVVFHHFPFIFVSLLLTPSDTVLFCLSGRLAFARFFAISDDISCALFAISFAHIQTFSYLTSCIELLRISASLITPN